MPSSQEPDLLDLVVAANRIFAVSIQPIHPDVPNELSARVFRPKVNALTMTYTIPTVGEFTSISVTLCTNNPLLGIPESAFNVVQKALCSNTLQIGVWTDTINQFVTEIPNSQLAALKSCTHLRPHQLMLKIRSDWKGIFERSGSICLMASDGVTECHRWPTFFRLPAEEIQKLLLRCLEEYARDENL